MSALLCSKIEKAFVDAQKPDVFFSDVELRKIRNELEPREQPVIRVPRESCKNNLFFGFFFDGTRNNYIQAETDKSHSNVARLYDCYPGWSVPRVLPTDTDWQYQPKNYTHFFKAYVPGVASPFEQVHDSGEGMDRTLGGATGAKAQERIIWALVQAINNVHRYFLKTSLVTQPELDGLFKRIVLTKHSRRLMEGPSWAVAQMPYSDASLVTRKEFERLLGRLHKAIANHWPDEKTGKPAKVDPGVVKTIYVSTFGFSRGATQARAFTNWFLSLCRLDAQLRGKPAGKLTLGGFDVEFDFLGLFDTVASIGTGNTMGNSTFGRLFDGHGAWADAEDSLRIPDGVKCLHLVSAHELRRSFPLDSISVKGALSDGCQEIVIPGVHSDVGCGYAPGEQGRGTDANGDDMLARIPLLMMYKAARLNGVPLKLELANRPARARFALKAETINAFNAYIATCKVTTGPLHHIMREQARKQMEWRLARRVTGKSPIQSSASFLRASNFDKNDLYSAAGEFEEEIAKFNAWLKEKGSSFKPAGQQAGFDNEHEAEWEEIAAWWQRWAMPSAEVMNFFDNYVHDSRASFKLIPGNPESEAEMHKKLVNWVALRKAALAADARRPKVQGMASARLGPQATDVLNDDERRAADEYAATGKIPRMTTAGREPFSSARAGYLRFRKIYSGWDSELISAVPADQSDGPLIASVAPPRASGSATG
jgi:hypothetical protein